MHTEFVIAAYKTSAGKQPFDDRLDKLRRRNHIAAAAIDSRIARIRDQGNFGDSRSVGQGVQELRIHMGPGYRVYYVLHGQTMVILLVGEKKSQQRSIAKAHEYALDFRRRL
jgi:putative addiction module killer protein